MPAISIPAPRGGNPLTLVHPPPPRYSGNAALDGEVAVPSPERVPATRSSWVDRLLEAVQPVQRTGTWR